VRKTAKPLVQAALFSLILVSACMSQSPPGGGGTTAPEGRPGEVEPPSSPAKEDLARWQKRRDVLLDTTPAGAGIATNLENYPVPIRLDKINFDFAQAKPDGSDLRFAKADGPLLAHEIELWDSISRNRT
jgi:hypothetical protein